MTESAGTRTRGRPAVAVLAVLWVGLGFQAVEVGDMWRGAAGVVLGALFYASYRWPGSAVDRFTSGPVLRRKK